MINVSFLDVPGKTATLRVRNNQQNEDEDGNCESCAMDSPTTSYFPGDSGQDPSWLMGAEFKSAREANVRCRWEELYVRRVCARAAHSRGRAQLTHTDGFCWSPTNHGITHDRLEYHSSVIAAATIVAVAELSKALPALWCAAALITCSEHPRVLVQLVSISRFAGDFKTSARDDRSGGIGAAVFLALCVCRTLGVGFWTAMGLGVLLAALSVGGWLWFGPSQ